MVGWLGNGGVCWGVGGRGHNEANQNGAHSNRVAIGRRCQRTLYRMEKEPGASGGLGGVKSSLVVALARRRLPTCLPQTHTNAPLYYSRQQLIVGVAMTTGPSIFKAVPLINSCSAVARGAGWVVGGDGGGRGAAVGGKG